MQGRKIDIRLIIAATVILVVAVFSVINIMDSLKIRSKVAEERTNLMQEKADLEREKENLTQLEQYIGTEEFMERYVKNMLHYCPPDEIYITYK